VRRWGALMGVTALVVVAAAILAREAGLLTVIEQQSIDVRFALRGDHAARNVAVVGLDSSSYAQLPRPPLPRALDARLIDALHGAGARVIALDLALERPGPTQSGDRAVVAALERARPAVVSVTVVLRHGVTEPLVGRVPFGRVPGVLPGLTDTAVPDSDGSLRRFPRTFDGVRSFAAVAASAFDGRAVASAPRALIDYSGGAGHVTTIPLVDVLRGRFNTAAVRGRVVVVGETAPVLLDIHETPAAGGGVMPGPEIVANEIETAIGGFPLRYAASLLDIALITLLAVAAPLASLCVGARRLDGLLLVLGGFVALAIWSVAVQLAFDSGTVLDYSDGVLAIVVSTGAVWSGTSVLERRERRRLRARFAAYEADVVEPVIAARNQVPLEPDRVIAGFRIAHGPPIGRGGMGVVWRAQQIDLQRDVALKVLLPEYALDSHYRKRFADEVLNAAAISHPHVVPVFQAGEDPPLLYLAMQLIDAPNLEWWLADGPLPPALVARVVLQLGDALDAAHSPPHARDGTLTRRPIVHRDVKPANVILTTTEGLEHAFLTDFGLATEASTQARLSGHDSGSADYMAPEQVRAEPVTIRTDVYGLAALVFHTLTGRVPFERQTLEEKLAAHREDPRPSVRALRPDIRDGIDAVIARGMAVDPADRFATAGEFARATATALGYPLAAGTASGARSSDP
jgi:CHASE2 domain-containing sensor protein